MKRVPLYIIGALLLAFLVLGLLVRYSVLQEFDQHVSTEFQERMGQPLDGAMLAATFLGETAFLFVMTLVLAITFWRKEKRSAAIFLVLTLFSLPFVLGLKEMWARARPDETIFHVTGARYGYSFPSGHTLMGTAFYGALAVLCWVHIKDTRRRRLAAGGLALIPLLIGASRIYLGAHWLSDVLGGYFGGLILLFILTSFYVASLNTRKETPRRELAKAP